VFTRDTRHQLAALFTHLRRKIFMYISGSAVVKLATQPFLVPV